MLAPAKVKTPLLQQSNLQENQIISVADLAKAVLWIYEQPQYIPKILQNASLGRLLFPPKALKKIRHRVDYDSSFLEPWTKKSRQRP